MYVFLIYFAHIKTALFIENERTGGIGNEKEMDKLDAVSAAGGIRFGRMRRSVG